jgi:hypothetical protein
MSARLIPTSQSDLSFDLYLLPFFTSEGSVDAIAHTYIIPHSVSDSMVGLLQPSIMGKLYCSDVTKSLSRY